jgi:phenylpropionate dioxygenase-like ring-hydroxylating dioxygenase large terminal subunit
MGEVMRRYWAPALLSFEIAEPDSPPVIIKLLGEELVAFRDTDGKVGIVGARCAHRRAHMFWGRNEECGLRCVYHGWKFDVNGVCTDMPSEPSESNFKDKVKIPAYPTFERGGIIYCYMGPAERQPPPPLFDWTSVPDEQRRVTKVWQECNWLQALEGGIDTCHSTFLHDGKPPGVPYDNSPRGQGNNYSLALDVEVIPTDYGYAYAGIRKMNAAGDAYVRGYHWVLPWNQIRASGDASGSLGTTVSGHCWVPMDDENCMVYNWTYSYKAPLRGGGQTASEQSNYYGEVVEPENNYRSLYNMDNKYGIDREVQRTETYTGVPRTNNLQDRAIQESMGPIADRTLERLGTTDRAIINARRTLLNAVKIVQDGGDPPGTGTSYYKCRAVERVVPGDKHWFEEMRAEMYSEEVRAPAQWS